MSYRYISSLSSLLRNCVSVAAISQAKQIHAHIRVHGFLPNVTLQTDLLLSYSKCGYLQYARYVFDEMCQRKMHSWNILIASYVQNSLYSDAISIFFEFRKTGHSPDHYTLPMLFKACMGIGDDCMGKLLHGWVIKLGFEEYVVVGSSILDFYVKSGNVIDARQAFCSMRWKDTIVWNSMISGFGKAGLYAEALLCFKNMIDEGMEMDSVTIPSVVNACGREGDLMKGKEIHGVVIKRVVFDADVVIGNSLIDMYGKCGCLRASEKVFKNMRELNMVTWTTMISCYGVHGKAEESLALFENMIGCGFKPNQVTLTAVLASCSHSGFVDEGRRIFDSISLDYGFEPSEEHYACMVDLLGRCGYLEEALGLAKNRKLVATASVWGSLLASCMMHKNVEIGEIAAHRLFELEPRNSSNYVSLCSIYKVLGIWDGVSKTRVKMKALNMVKTPGRSWVTVGGVIHKFYERDQSHPSTQIIYQILERLNMGPILVDDCG